MVPQDAVYVEIGTVDPFDDHACTLSTTQRQDPVATLGTLTVTFT